MKTDPLAAFIADYRRLLHREADAQADWLAEQLSDVRTSGLADPRARACWAAFERLVSSDATLEEKLRRYGFVLAGGDLGRLQ